MASPRGAAAPARLDLAAEVQRKQQQQHGSSAATGGSQHQPTSPQRRPRVADGRPTITIAAVYPAVMPAMPGSPSALQREQQQQQWAQAPGGMPGKGLVRAPCTRI
jgi:hypothetical protein